MDGGGRKVRVPGLSGLSFKKVVLIGCGSMGSKIGAGIAATGVENFGLVDFDFLEPDNAVRHELGVDFFGCPKTAALANRLIHLNPGAAGKITALDLVIGQINDTAQETKFQGLIASADLVIETTGDHGISRFLNDVCSNLKVPQLYASVTNGAWAGEIVRVIPDKTACWLCWNDQYYKLAPPGEPPPGPGVFAPGCDQPTFTGTTYDVGIVANLACEIAVDALLIDDESRKHFSGDYVRWQMKDADGNVLPKIDVLAVEKRHDCRVCGQQNV
jgi:molybdopterin/thiamine biosynthesis adenylyltransferase